MNIKNGCEEVNYQGTAIIFDFDETLTDYCRFWNHQTVSVNYDLVITRYYPNHFVNSENCVIESHKNKKLLYNFQNNILKKTFKAMWHLLRDRLDERNGLKSEIEMRYAKVEKRHKKCVEMRVLDRIQNYKDIIDKYSFKKKIVKLHNMKTVLKLILKNEKSISSVSKITRLPQSKINKMLKEIRKSNGQIIVDLEAAIIEEIALYDYLNKFCKYIKENNHMKNFTLKALFNEAKENLKGLYNVTFSKFYSVFKNNGFKYQNIRYAPKVYRQIKGRHLNAFLDIYVYFITLKSKFKVIFIDESSVCTSNLKKKRLGKLKESHPLFLVTLSMRN